MKHKILLTLLLAVLSVMGVFAHEVEKWENDDTHQVFYSYEGVFYQIINEEEKEVMVVPPSRIHIIFSSFYYWDKLINIPPDIHINGEQYAVTTIGSDSFIGLIYPLGMSDSVTKVEADNFNASEQPILWSANIESIGMNCLNNCTFSTLILPQKLTTLGAECLNDNLFERIDFQDHSELQEIGENSFCRNTNLKTLFFPKSLQRIGRDSFCGNAMVTYYVPGVQIGDGCFCNNESLEKLELDDNIQIGDNCFNNNRLLHELTFNGDFSGMKDCFNQCPELSMISFQSKYPSENLNIPDSSFADLNCDICVITVPDGSKTAYEEAIRNCGNSRIASLPVLGIGEYEAGVENLYSEPTAETEYFTLSGMKVDPDKSSSAPQLLIKRQGNHVKKVIR